MGFFKKKEKEEPVKELKAMVSGRVIPVTEVAGPVFSSKALGDGIAIRPGDHGTMQRRDFHGGGDRPCSGDHGEQRGRAAVAYRTGYGITERRRIQGDGKTGEESKAGGCTAGV